MQAAIIFKLFGKVFKLGSILKVIKEVLEAI